jgi:hypothetical protein
MTRSKFQPGPATDHYHDTLGVDEATLGQLQVVGLIGPIRISWDDDGIAVAPGLPIADLVAGQVVLSAWVELIAWWNGDDIGDATTLEILVGGADWEAQNTWPVVEVQVHENGASGIADSNIAPSAVPHPMYPIGTV